MKHEYVSTDGLILMKVYLGFQGERNQLMIWDFTEFGTNGEMKI